MENKEFELLDQIYNLRKQITIVKDATNPHFKNGYPKLFQIVSKIDEKIGSLKIRYVQTQKDGVVITKILHKNGSFIETESPLINERGNSQGFGSGQTYSMRYGICLAFGLTPTDDDDGNASVKNNDQPKEEEYKHTGGNDFPEDATLKRKFWGIFKSMTNDFQDKEAGNEIMNRLNIRSGEDVKYSKDINQLKIWVENIERLKKNDPNF